jgi:predicted nucleotidyltransferase
LRDVFRFDSWQMLEMKAREGDFVETSENLIFDVKGLVHPPGRIIAFIRYFPDEKGQRKKDGEAYGKVYSFSERYNLLKSRFPKYVVYDPVFDETVCEILETDIRKRYDPIEKLSQLRTSENSDLLEEKAVHLVEKLKEQSNIPWNAFGISGSILVGLHETESDIDPIVYGSDNCRRVYSDLRELLKEAGSRFKPYNVDELKGLFGFRSKDTVMSFKEFVRTESKKVFQGKFAGTDYFVRFVKDWNEIHDKYGDIQYRNVGYAKVKAVVADDSESIFTPCTYVLEEATVLDGPKHAQIKEIASFRRRFCDQARNGDEIVAQGKVEKVTNMQENREYLRLLIGNKPSDYMIVA